MIRRAVPTWKLAGISLLSSDKLNRPKTSRPMEIKLIHRRPGRPVRMRDLLGTLKKVSPPDLTFYSPEGAEIVFKQREGNEESQSPKRRFLNFRFNPLRQRG